MHADVSRLLREAADTLRNISDSSYPATVEGAVDLVEPVHYIHGNVNFDDNPRDLTKKIFQTNLKAVEDTMRVLDPEMIEFAVKP